MKICSIVTCFILIMFTLTSVAVESEDYINAINQNIKTIEKSNSDKLENLISKSLADIFPESTCWGDKYDIEISNVTGGLLGSCHGDPNIAINIAIFERDLGGFPNDDDLVVEKWLVFPTNGLTAGIPFSHTYPEIDLSKECDETDWVGEFYIKVRGQCLMADLIFGEENVSLIYKPYSPALVYPTYNAINMDKSFTLQWNSVMNTDYYQVQVDDISNFTSPLYDEQSTATNFLIGELQSSTKYYWRIRSHNNTCGDGNWSATYTFTTGDFTDVAEINTSALPETFSLKQNYPNPFNPSTQIEFSLPHSSFVKFEIYNITGQKIKTLINQQLSAGAKIVDWDGTDDDGDLAPSGIYVYRLITDDFQASKKMMLLK